MRWVSLIPRRRGVWPGQGLQEKLGGKVSAAQPTAAGPGDPQPSFPEGPGWPAGGSAELRIFSGSQT